MKMIFLIKAARWRKLGKGRKICNDRSSVTFLPTYKYLIALSPPSPGTELVALAGAQQDRKGGWVNRQTNTGLMGTKVLGSRILFLFPNTALNQ